MVAPATRIRFAGRRRGRAGRTSLFGAGICLALLGACSPRSTSPSPGVSPPAVSLAQPRPAVDCRPPVQLHPDRQVRLEQLREHLRDCGAQRAAVLASELLAFPTVSAELPTTRPAFTAMGRYLEQWAGRTGMQFRRIGDDDVWEVQLGEGEARTGFVMHGDVVPVGEPALAVAEAATVPADWQRTPFEAFIGGGKLQGRGSEDDKGPIAAVLVAMEALAQWQLLPKHPVVAIIGNAEESNWKPMRAYAASKPPPEHVISLDAEFPVVVAESGFVALHLALPRQVAVAGSSKPRTPKPAIAMPAAAEAGCATVEALHAGEFLTQVPGRAELTVRLPDAAAATRLGAQWTRALAEPLRAHVALEQDGARLTWRASGKAVHSSIAETGHNAMWDLAAAAEDLPLCSGAAADALALLRTRFVGDHWGQKLGLAYRHPVMGRLLVIPTLLRLKDERVELGVNMRRPAGKTVAEFGKALDGMLARLRLRYPKLGEHDKRYVGEVHQAALSGRLAPTLLGIYRDLSDQPHAETLSIRGGTYARLFPGAVSFGPSLPGHHYSGHAPNEFITLDALALLTRASLEAIVRLDE